jgi:hypothetical protein
MLNEEQTNRVWEKMLSARVRSFYFGDLAARYTARKQWITGLSFVLSSGAAATALARMPVWVTSTSAILASILTAYSMAVGLDKAAPQMAKLHYAWNQLDAEYHRLWIHWYEEEAEKTFDELQRRSADVSQMSTDAPFREKLIAKWEDRVLLAEYGRA